MNQIYNSLFGLQLGCISVVTRPTFQMQRYLVIVEPCWASCKVPIHVDKSNNQYNLEGISKSIHSKDDTLPTYQYIRIST